MRKEITDRGYRMFTYQETDRVPDVEFGYWPQTIRRWLREGMPLDLTPDEQNQMFLGKLAGRIEKVLEETEQSSRPNEQSASGDPALENTPATGMFQDKVQTGSDT